MVAQDYEMNAEQTAAHFELPIRIIQSALHYYDAFPNEIDSVISELRSMTFEKLQRKLPQLELHEIVLAM